MTLDDHEFVDIATGAVVRRLTVGALDTNCWIIADPSSKDAVVIDPGDEPARILNAVSDLHVRHLVLTHAHWDHVLGVPALHDAVGVAPLLHVDDRPVWPHELGYHQVHGHFDAGTATANLVACGCAPTVPVGEELWSGEFLPVADGELIRFGELAVRVIATPGHTPGGICLTIGTQVFTGDTLFPGGAGLTGWPLSDFATIIDSIRTRLFTLPEDTVAHPGHGRDTTIGTERPSLPEWIGRGW